MAAPPLPKHRPTRAELALIAAAGVAMCVISVLVCLSPGSDATALAAFGRVLLVAVPLAVGAFASLRPQSRRFGRQLMLAAVVAFLTTLAESDDSLLYSIGRVAQWVLEAGLVYFVLSFPAGRLPGRIDRALVGAATLLLVTLYLPSALFADPYAVPNPATSCIEACPDNAFAVMSQPAAFDDVLRPLRDGLLVLIFIAVAIRLAWRVRTASRLTRLTLTPVLVVATARLAVFVSAVGIRRADADAAALPALTWLIALGVPALALAFLVGLLRWRLFVGEALERLAARLHAGVRPRELRAALAEVFGDQTLALVYAGGPRAPRWIDAEGNAASLREDDPTRTVTYVANGGPPIAAITHDAALRDQRDFTEAAASYALMALENQRLSAEVRSSLREVTESRTRMVTTADRERQRIERDLHDGAQQRLVALRVRLELAEELIEQDPERGRERVHAIGIEIGAALDEIRDLARGVYPPLLAEQGLAEAIRGAAVQGPIATSIRTDGVGRHSEEIERAVYFCCLEALQNASKHADGATTITIVLAETPEALTLEVRDNGAGFDRGRTPDGAGIANMVDRLAAVGGTLSVRSVLREGTVVQGSLPLV